MGKRAYQKLGFTEEGHMRDFLARDDVQTMIGENYHHYRELWLAKFEYKVLDGPKPQVKGWFNWLALLGFIIWAGYRKLYAFYWSFVLMIAALIFAEVYYGFEIRPGAFIGMNVALAILSKDLYFQHLVACTKKLDKMQDDDKKAAFIAKRAGTSNLFAYLSFPIAVIILVVAVNLAATLK